MTNCMTLVLRNDLTELEQLNRRLEEFCNENAIPPRIMFQVNLALDEVVTNIISYSYPDGLQHEFTIDVAVKAGELVVRVSDDGMPFNPLTTPPPDIGLALEDRKVGGMGIHFVRSVMDGLEYERQEGRNVLQLRKSVCN